MLLDIERGEKDVKIRSIKISQITCDKTTAEKIYFVDFNEVTTHGSGSLCKDGDALSLSDACKSV